MNNKEAIRILGLECDEWDVSHCTASERREAFEMAITALDQLNNNSTKPDNLTQFNGIENKVKGLTACRVPGDDCISRADVEQTVEDNILCYTHSDRPIDQDPDTECHMAIRTALRMLRKDLRKLPSVQPVAKDTNVLNNDTISRAAAVDALKMDISIIPFAKAREYVQAAIETIYNRLEELPSVQPEIIHCRDCKHRKCFYETFKVCDKWGGRKIIKDDDFCSRSERRTDEQTKD